MTAVETPAAGPGRNRPPGRRGRGGTRPARQRTGGGGAGRKKSDTGCPISMLLIPAVAAIVAARHLYLAAAGLRRHLVDGRGAVFGRTNPAPPPTVPAAATWEPTAAGHLAAEGETRPPSAPSATSNTGGA